MFGRFDFSESLNIGRFDFSECLNIRKLYDLVVV